MVAVCCTNVPEYAEVALGVLSVGGVVAPCNSSLTTDELAHQISDSKAKYVVTEAKLYSRVAKSLTKCEGISEIFVLGNDELEIQEICGEDANNGLKWTSWESLMFEINPEIPSSILDPESVAFLPYGCGKAGVPACIELTQANMSSALSIGKTHMLASFEASKKTEGVCSLVAAGPLFQPANFILGLLAPLSCGFKVVCVPTWSEALFLRTVQENVATIATLFSPMLRVLASTKLVSAYDISGLYEVVCYSGIRVDEPGVTRECARQLQTNITQFYGAQETTVGTHVLCTKKPKADSPSWALSSQAAVNLGVPLPETKCKVMRLPKGYGRLSSIADMGYESSDFPSMAKNGKESISLKPLSLGEIFVKGPQIAPSFCSDGGYYSTGEVGYATETGQYMALPTFSRRETIQCRGFEVHAQEIENVLEQLPGISSVALVAVPVPGASPAMTWGAGGNTVVCFVEPDGLSGPRVDSDTVKNALIGRFSHFKVPSTVEFIRKLPRQSDGNIDRISLRVAGAQLVPSEEPEFFRGSLANIARALGLNNVAWFQNIGESEESFTYVHGLGLSTEVEVTPVVNDEEGPLQLAADTIKTLNENLKDAHHEIERLTKERNTGINASTNAEIKKLSDEVESLKSKLKEEKVERIKAQEEVQRQIALKQDVESRFVALSEQVAVHEQEFGRIDSARDSAEKEAELARQARFEAERKAKHAQQRLLNERDSNLIVVEEHRVLKLERQNLVRLLEQKMNSLEISTRSKATLASQFEKTRDELAKSKHKILALQEQLAASEAESNHYQFKFEDEIRARTIDAEHNTHRIASLVSALEEADIPIPPLHKRGQIRRLQQSSATMNNSIIRAITDISMQSPIGGSQNEEAPVLVRVLNAAREELEKTRESENWARSSVSKLKAALERTRAELSRVKKNFQLLEIENAVAVRYLAGLPKDSLPKPPSSIGSPEARDLGNEVHKAVAADFDSTPVRAGKNAKVASPSLETKTDTTAAASNQNIEISGNDGGHKDDMKARAVRIHKSGSMEVIFSQDPVDFDPTVVASHVQNLRSLFEANDMVLPLSQVGENSEYYTLNMPHEGVAAEGRLLHVGVRKDDTLVVVSASGEQHELLEMLAS